MSLHKKDLEGNLYLFDCFGVVVTDVSTLWMNTRFDAAQQDYIRKEIYKKVDLGEISFEHSFELISQKFGGDVPAMLRDWDACVTPIDGTLRILEVLKKRGGMVALLSNASSQYVNRLFDQFGLEKYFHRIFVSSNYHCAKPQESFYRIPLDAFHQKFDKVYFTDDNPDNLIAPRRLGIQTVLFETPEQLAAQLGISL